MARIAQWTAALVCLMAASTAGAQATPAKVPDLPPDLQQKFKQADITNRGGLNKAEAASAGFAAKGKFDDIDADHDHIITLYEIATYLASQGQQWAKADTNGDGVVSREEAEKVPSLAKIFNNADRDGDGMVRKEEYEAFSETTLYQNVDLPYVVPNIINKKF
jgi:hypothetical protein